MTRKNLIHAVVTLPAGDPIVIAPGETIHIDVPASGTPFKILRAEPVEGIDYRPFVCPGMFLGAMSFWSPANEMWPFILMWKDFSWPGGGLDWFNNSVKYMGEVDFRLLVRNEGSVQASFAIKLVGWEITP